MHLIYVKQYAQFQELHGLAVYSAGLTVCKLDVRISKGGAYATLEDAYII